VLAHAIHDGSGALQILALTALKRIGCVCIDFSRLPCLHFIFICITLALTYSDVSALVSVSRPASFPWVCRSFFVHSSRTHTLPLLKLRPHRSLNAPAHGLDGALDAAIARALSATAGVSSEKTCGLFMLRKAHTLFTYLKQILTKYFCPDMFPYTK